MKTCDLLASAKAGTALLREWIAETVQDDKEIDAWMEHGRWAESPAEFITAFLGTDAENERNERSDDEIVLNLVLQLGCEKKRNRAKRFVLQGWIDEGKPVNADEPMLVWVQLEAIVDKILEAL